MEKPTEKNSEKADWRGAVWYVGMLLYVFNTPTKPLWAMILWLVGGFVVMPLFLYLLTPKQSGKNNYPNSEK
ncbi:hypothetical protein [Mannheimia haemolytica]|uniref:hypothetical protein n=1 Tax=Mannheimia haemolytica TaxID=75985 RepID=UPI001ADA2A5D|nr:hypothetical protein [Mannheimia haemolytica]